MTHTTDKKYVKKETLFWAIVIAVSFGFMGGSLFTSFKLSKNTVTTSNNTRPDSHPQINDEEAGRMASQIFKLEQVLEKNPDDAKSWKRLGDLFFDLNQYANSIEAYKKYLSFDPDNVAVITDLGTMYRRNKQPEKAVETYQRAISINPEFETARFNKGIVLFHDLENPEAGIKEWEDLLSINPLALAPNGESLDAIVQDMKNKK